MPEILEVTGAAPVRGQSTSRFSSDLLNVVIVRLLTVALAIMARQKSDPAHNIGFGVPKGYRSWPAIEVDSGTGHTCQRLKFYISPKGAATADDEPFPVGTALVMEAGTSPDSYGERSLSVVVMKKVSSMDAYRGNIADQDGWVYALYDQAGRILVSDSAACGICWLQLM